MQFSLRTLLVATTAVAIYVGGSLGMVRTLNIWRGGSGLGPLNYVYLLSDLPMFALWVVGAVWAFDRRERPGMKALVCGLALTAAWRFASPLVQSMLFQSLSSGSASQQFAFAAFTLINALVQTTNWTLILYAFVKVAESSSTPDLLRQDPLPANADDR